MNFQLQSATECEEVAKDSNSNDYNIEYGLERQFVVFFLVNLISFIIYFSFACYIAIKSSFKLDAKAWANMAVNSASFSIKAMAWTYMLSIYDKNEEEK